MFRALIRARVFPVVKIPFKIRVQVFVILPESLDITAGIAVNYATAFQRLRNRFVGRNARDESSY